MKSTRTTGRDAGPDGVRRTNLARVLRLIHESGPRSRANITGETGLNRSTVADLVTTLAAHGLLVEHDPETTRRVGRPSPIVAPSPDVVAIGVNPEVDAIELGAVTLGGGVRVRTRLGADRPTSEDVVGAVGETLRAWATDELASCRIIGIGIAVPGLVRTEDGLIRLAPHLGWHDTDLAGPVVATTGLPVTVANDASLGTRAEVLFGAARGHADVISLNGGASGIGGGVVLDGRLIGGSGGYAGEWGHTFAGGIVAADRRSDSGVLEDEVNRARLLAALGLHAADDATLARALRAGSSAASGNIIEEVLRQRRVLAASLASAANVLNPSAIVLGGFLAILRDQDASAFDANVRSAALAAAAEDLVITSAALGDDRLLIGAADAALAPLLADPLA